jgi:hypothetical protein
MRKNESDMQMHSFSYGLQISRANCFHFKYFIVIFAAYLNKDDKSQLYFYSQYSARYSTLGAGLRMVCVLSNKENDISHSQQRVAFFDV